MSLGNLDNGNLSFSELYGSLLDRRIIQSLTKSNLIIPTKVQVEVIKEAIEGKDLLINSYTGSGKTLAYAIPICHNLLNTPKKINNKIYTLILVPSRELVMQTYEVFERLLLYCEDLISVGTIFNADEDLLRKEESKLNNFRNNILISTPGDICKTIYACNKGLLLRDIQHLIVDEADLLFAFGYEKDIKKIIELLPNSQNRKYQCILLSATLNQETELIDKMLLHKPVIINIKPDHMDEDKFIIETNISNQENKLLLNEYYTICNEIVDKWLMLYILLKMNVIPRKCLIFVSEVDTAYSIKLFFERFGINCGVLTPIIPAATRRMLIQCFNQGSFDILVTCNISENDNIKFNLPRDDSITHRGVDYKEVASVLNFDCPTSLRSYVHHIGRTARGGASGVSVTIINGNIPNEMEILNQLLLDKNRKLNRLKITSEEVSCFKYRIEDCMRILTKSNIQRCKLQEIQGLILSNTRLLKSGYFNKHPEDKNVLKSYHKYITNMLNISNSGREHIKNIPGYLYDIVNNNISQNSTLDCSNNLSSITKDRIFSNYDVKNSSQSLNLTEKVQEAIRKMGGKDFQFVKENNLNPINVKEDDQIQRRKRVVTRKSQLKKEPKDYEDTVPDELPPISGRKLWKIKHRKYVRKYKDFIDDNKYKKGIRR